jgi:dihydropteridine reductase
MSATITKRILCIGGSGQLGKHIISTMLPYSVTNIDFNTNVNTKSNIVLKSNLNASQNNKDVINYFQKEGKGSVFDAIVVSAGGWVGGSIKDDDYLHKVNNMLEVNLMPSLLAAHLATKYLADKGLVVFTGAAAVFK